MSLPSQESLIGIGRSAEIYARQEHQVIKLFHANCPPDLADFEAKKSHLINSMDLPTPRFIGMVEVEGRKGLIYERVYGISMLKMINQRPWSLFRLARHLAELHHAIHQQDGAGFPSMHSDLDAVIRWTVSLPGIPAGKVVKLLKELPEGHLLCHFDFHPDQVMMTDRGPVILDWSAACQGHPLADVAQTAILLKVGQVPYGGRVMQTIINLWRGFFLEAYLNHYFKLDHHLHRTDLAPWLIPVAVGRLNEGITGERESLLGLIESTLAALGMASSQSVRGQFHRHSSFR